MSEKRQRSWQLWVQTLRMALVLGVTFFVAALIWLRGSPAAAPGAGQSQTVLADGVRVTLQLDGATAGPRVVDVLTSDASGRPVDASAVRLRFTMTEMAMRAVEVEARPLGRGHFQAQDALFSMAGRWVIVATVAREAGAPLSATFVFPIAEASEVSVLLNPLAPDAAVLAAGQGLYRANCVACHGATGKGDGPLAVSLRPAPGDLAEHMAQGKHSDGQLFVWVRDGYPDSAMPAWGERLSDEQIWQLVTYLRTFAAPATQAARATATPPAAPAPTAGATVAEPLPPLIFTRAGNLWHSDGSAEAPRQLTRLEPGSYAQYPALSPDGSLITFVITSQGPLGEEEWPQLNPDTRLAVMGADGPGLQVLWDPESGVLGQPVWSPDGQAIYAARSDILSPPDAPVADRLFEIVRVDHATGARAVALEDAFDLSFSRDGRQIVFLRWNEQFTSFTLSVASADGGDERELLPWSTFPRASSPRFSPDGRRVLFVSAGGPATDEQGYPLSRAERSPLERALGLLGPSIAEAHGLAADLWIVNVDGSELRRLTTLREDAPMGIFSPDGGQIVVLAAGGIYALKADGSELRQLDPVGDHGGLDWGAAIR